MVLANLQELGRRQAAKPTDGKKFCRRIDGVVVVMHDRVAGCCFDFVRNTSLRQWAGGG